MACAVYVPGMFPADDFQIVQVPLAEDKADGGDAGSVLRGEPGLPAAGHVYAGPDEIHAPADVYQVGAYAVSPHTAAALYDAYTAAVVYFQFRVGGAEADAQAVQYPGHQLPDAGQKPGVHVQGRLEMPRLHEEGGAGGELLRAGQKVVFSLPGDVFYAVFPAGGKLLHQGFFLKGMAPGLFYGPGQLGGLRHLEDPPAAGAVCWLNYDGVIQLQSLRLLRGGHQAALAGRQSGLFKGQAHQVLVGGCHGADHTVAGKAQLLGDVVYGYGGQVRANGDHAHGGEHTADVQNPVRLHYADRIEIICAAFPQVAALPGEDMGGVAHGLGGENEGILKFVCADDDQIFFFSVHRSSHHRVKIIIPRSIRKRAKSLRRPTFSLKIVTPKMVTKI